MFSVEAYLQAWNRHVDACIGSIPADRRLVLRTHELGSSQQRLAGFLRIPASSLDNCGILNRGTWTQRIDSFVDPSYLDEMIHTVCGSNMELLFPEVRSPRDAAGMWTDDSDRIPAGPG